MGRSFSKLFDKLAGKRKLKLLMLGLDFGGKTTILYKLKLGEVVNTIPTIGLNIETIEYKGILINCWDVGGSARIKMLWRYYYRETQGIIFVVDSSDKDRIAVAKEELDSLLSEELLKDAVLLVLANKQDISGVLSVTEIAEMLDLTTIKSRESGIFKVLVQRVVKVCMKVLTGWHKPSPRRRRAMKTNSHNNHRTYFFDFFIVLMDQTFLC